MAILRRIFFRISFSNFWFLSLLLARSRRVLANLEERIQKFIDAAFFWPVENVPDTQRARARARPSCSTGASGPFDDRRLRSTTFRARATLVLLLYRTFFGALIVLLQLEANLSGSTLTCRFTFIYRFFGPLKGLPLNTLENYGMAS